MPVYLCDYTYRGEHYSFDLRADGPDDAEARAAAIRRNMAVAGELEARIPVEAVSLVVGLMSASGATLPA